MKNIIISCLLFLVSIVSVSAIAESSAISKVVENSEQANLIIYRPKDRSGINYRVAVNGQYFGKLKPNKALRLQVEPGEHIISTSDAKQTQVVINVIEGKETFVQAIIDRKSQVTLTQTEEMKLALR